jgi:glycerophosphoryl diester phosphodiesterase
MPAFQHAVDLGYTYLETDVHATSDGVLVAFHDADLARTCGRPGRIDSLPWREVSAARVNGAEPIPLFEDLIGAFPEARFNIDCKANSGLAALIASLKRLDCLDRVCLGGFNDQRLRRLRREFGDRLCSSFGPVQMASLRTGARVPFGGQLAQVPVRVGRVEVVTPGTVARAHRRGYHVHVWTIDDPAEMTRLLDLGVDGIMTDRPQVLREVLSARGEWR